MAVLSMFDPNHKFDLFFIYSIEKKKNNAKGIKNMYSSRQDSNRSKKKKSHFKLINLKIE